MDEGVGRQEALCLPIERQGFISPNGFRQKQLQPVAKAA